MPDGDRHRSARWPRLLYRDEAAVYVGVSPNQFDKEVALGIWPAPLDAETIRRALGVSGYDCRRKRWDRRALDRSVDRISGLDHPKSAEEQELDAGL